MTGSKKRNSSPEEINDASARLVKELRAFIREDVNEALQEVFSLSIIESQMPNTQISDDLLSIYRKNHPDNDIPGVRE